MSDKTTDKIRKRLAETEPPQQHLTPTFQPKELKELADRMMAHLELIRAIRRPLVEAGIPLKRSMSLADLARFLKLDLEKATAGDMLSAARAEADRYEAEHPQPVMVTTPDENIPDDAPTPPDGFTYKGQKFQGLTPKPMRLIIHLWIQTNRTSRFDDLADPVWGDRNEIVTKDAVGSLRRQANKFFKDNNIPFRVTINEPHVTLKTRDE